jgi:hypothetical protein
MARTRQVTSSERALVDALVDAYAGWREEAAAVERRYREWAGATEADRALAFAAYEAALDNEEHASYRYAASVADFRCARRWSGRGG